MSKMKKLLVLALVSNMAVSATFVPASTYRDYTCDELKEDYIGWHRAWVDSVLNNPVNFNTVNRYSVTKENEAQEEAKAHKAAIEKQAAKVGCELPK